MSLQEEKAKKKSTKVGKVRPTTTPELLAASSKSTTVIFRPNANSYIFCLHTKL